LTIKIEFGFFLLVLTLMFLGKRDYGNPKFDWEVSKFWPRTISPDDQT